MKKLISLFALFALSAPVYAAQTQTAVLFTNATTNSTSVVSKVTGYRTKTLSVSGVSGSSFANFSGTIVATGGPTTSGPWHALSQQDATAASVTGNGGITWDDAVNYVRLTFTKSARGARAFKAWLMSNEN